MVQRSGTFAVFPAVRRKLHQPPVRNRPIGDLIAEELRTRARGSAFARYGRPSRPPLPERSNKD